MKVIEKTTADGDVQTFQKYSRKNLKGIIEKYFDCVQSFDEDTRFSSRKAAWENYFEDCGLFWELDDGTTGSLDICGLDGKRPPVSRIVKLHENGYGCYTGFFGKGVTIEQNEHYGDWEVVGI